jgi:hypothetical protein
MSRLAAVPVRGTAQTGSCSAPPDQAAATVGGRSHEERHSPAGALAIGVMPGQPCTRPGAPTVPSGWWGPGQTGAVARPPGLCRSGSAGVSAPAVGRVLGRHGLPIRGAAVHVRVTRGDHGPASSDGVPSGTRHRPPCRGRCLVGGRDRC